VLSDEQIRRYNRHMILPQIGRDGQERLLAARVLLVGAGGLGSPVALYLAAAGVGTLGIVDFDTVDLSNLQRQILHHVHDLGRPKAISASETIGDLNPDVKVVPYALSLDADNAMEIISGYDIVVNCCDNFATRYLTNDACVLLGKPLVEGSVYHFEGQATVFLPGMGCYRCLFPAPQAPNSGVASPTGILGVAPGIIGVVQANEVIKLILGIGETLAGRLLLLDCLNSEFRQVRFRRNPNCPACGDTPSITTLAVAHKPLE